MRLAPAAALVAGLLAPLAAGASHPLITEDTGVLGAGVWQVELHGEAIRRERDELAAVLSYGVLESADLQLEAPRDGESTLSLKWRFHEHGPVSLVFKPDATDSGWGANLVAGLQQGGVELLGHLGYSREHGASSRHASIAALWSLTGALKLAFDAARDTGPDTDTYVVGALYALAEDIDLGFGRKGGDERAWLLGVKLRW
jgi:hypothetical protein